MTYQIELNNEIIVDNFAGGGGASHGIECALNRPVNIAINHDQQAIDMHTANHPLTQHYCEDVFQVSPRELCGDRKIGLAWFSPDCKHFSRAKGGTPKNKKIRGLAWVVMRWASLPAENKPRIIMLENVPEFMDWGPLKDGEADPEQKGETFKLFVKTLKSHGYTVEWKQIKACDYGTPTIRKRLFMIARSDNMPIIWPKPTHGENLKPYISAGTCIDWSVPFKSVFGRKRKLADNTFKRIAKGIQKYIIEADKPFNPDNAKEVTFLTEHANASSLRVFDINKPLNTQCAEVKGGHFAAVTVKMKEVPQPDNAEEIGAFLVKYYGTSSCTDLNDPLHTTTTNNKHALVAVKLRPADKQCIESDITPEINAFLIKYYGASHGADLKDPLHTVTTKDRFALITVKRKAYQIIDIGMRMLTPRELFLAQGFGPDYIIDRTATGQKITVKEQVHKCGNSVCPPVAQALVAANYHVNSSTDKNEVAS